MRLSRTLTAAALAIIVATLSTPDLRLWAPWVLETWLISVSTATYGPRAWPALAPEPVRARAVAEVDGPSLCAGRATTALDLRRPFVIRGAAPTNNFTTEALTKPPLGDVVVDYFYDASRRRHLVPDARAKLSKVVRNISRGRPHKIGSQRVLSREGCCPTTEALEAALARLAPRCSVGDVVGRWRLSAAALDARLLTVPLFVSGGGGDERPTYTDLHSEPIASMAIQIEGSKDWTLVPAADSASLRPAASPDGRAYFYSRLDDGALARLPRLAVTTWPGDALWVPPWTWHAVSYAPAAGVSVAASLFHFRPWAFVAAQPYFAAAVLPNLAKEIFGIKTQ